MLLMHRNPDAPQRVGMGWRFWLITAAVSLLITGVVFVLWPHQAPTAGNPVPAPDLAAPGLTGAPAPAAPGGSLCPNLFPDPYQGEVQAQQIAVPPTTWSLIDGIATPAAPEIGPQVQYQVHACYRHVPWGALFAATNYAAQSVDPAVDPAVLLQVTCAAGATRDALITEYQGGSGGSPRKRTVAQPQWVGFRFTNYTDSNAVIQLVHQYKAVFVVDTLTLRWESGDWRVVLPDQAEAVVAEFTVPYLDTAVYVSWGP